MPSRRSRSISWLILLGWINIALAVPFVPPPVVSPAAIELQQAINTVAASLATLTIAPGSYVFSDNHLTITNASDLVIEAVGVTFVFYYC